MNQIPDLIPKRYPYTIDSQILPRDLLAKHELQGLLAMHFRCAEFELVLDRSTRDALPTLADIVNPHVLYRHVKNFPDQYVPDAAVATQTLLDVYTKFYGLAEIFRQGGQVLDREPADQIMTRLVQSGANPFFVLCREEITAHDLGKLLRHMPQPEKCVSRTGYTLVHAHCHDVNFVEQKLPVLIRYGADLNAAPHSGSLVGTAGHTLVANEYFDIALSYIQSPLTRNILDPRVTDGEKKTLPIIAAKVMAEDVLLALADLYPEKLALDAQDDQGRTVMHYLFAYGLKRAAHRYMDLTPNLDIPDHKGRKPADYFDLPREEVGEILRSIEIHPDRDAGAPKNAITGDHDFRAPIAVEDRQLLFESRNFTRELVLMFNEHSGEAGVRILAQQFVRLQRISLLNKILENRAELKREFEGGLLSPKQAEGTVHGPEGDRHTPR